METTFYSFLSNIKAFLGSLLKNPIKAEPNDFLKERGFSKAKLINILLKRDILRRHESIDDKEKETKGINYKVTYKVVRHQFERKVRRIYNKYFENNEDGIEETTACGASSGQYSMPLFGQPIRRKMVGESEEKEKPIKRGKNIFITKKQLEKLREEIVLNSFGNYQYDVPFPVKKNDPTLIHRKKGGIGCDRVKK